MALNQSSVVSAAMGKLSSKGFVTDSNHAKQQVMVEAIVEAVIEAITRDAQVVVASGSSAGSYKVS